MAVYEVELDSGGQYIQQALSILGGAISARKKAKADAPGLTKDLTEKILSEGKDIAPEDAWKIVSKVFPKADRDVFESIYFGRVLDQAERNESIAGGFITAMKGKYKQKVPGSASSSAPATALPSPMSPSPGVGSVFNEIATNAIQGKAAEASPTGGIAPPSAAPLSGDPTDDSVVGKAVAQAGQATAGVQLPEGINTEAANGTELTQQFQSLVGKLSPEHIDYFTATAQKLRGDAYGRVNEMLGYNVRDRLSKYGMAPSAQRMVINGIVGQLAGVRDVAKEELVFNKTFADVADTWRGLDQKDRELGARVIEMYAGLQTRIKELGLKGAELEFQAKYQKAMVELQKMGVETDRARLILTAAMGTEEAGKAGGTGGSGRNSTAGTVDDTLKVIERMQGFETQLQQAGAIKDEKERIATIGRIRASQAAALNLISQASPHTAALTLAYMDASDMYTDTQVAQTLFSMFRDVPGLKERLDNVFMANTQPQRQTALVEFFQTVEEPIQKYIGTLPPELANFHRKTWESLKRKGQLGVLAFEDAASQAGAITSPTGPFAGERGGIPISSTPRQSALNALAGGGATAQSPLASPDLVKAVGVPAKADTAALQEPHIQAVVTATDTANQQYGTSLEPTLVAAVIDQESTWDTQAKGKKGEVGLMQLMPGTAKDMGVTDATNPHQNILGGTRYLASLVNKYEGNIDLALAAYNWGPGNVDRAIANGAPGGIPRDVANYVSSVKNFWSERKTERRI